MRSSLNENSQEADAHLLSAKLGVPCSELAISDTVTDASREDVEKALAFLQTKSDKRRPGLRPVFFLGLILPLMWAISIGIMEGDWRGTAAISLFAAISLLLARNVLSSRHREAGQMLSTQDDVRIVGALADMLAWPDPRDWPKAMEGLMRVLPWLKASDSHLLSQSQRSILYRLLVIGQARKHGRYMVTLLRALEQIGDDSSIAPVRRLAQSTARTASETEVKRAAEECLRALQERVGRGDVPHTLLRAASNAAPETALLKPAGAAGNAEVDLLLRPQ